MQRGRITVGGHSSGSASTLSLINSNELLSLLLSHNLLHSSVPQTSCVHPSWYILLSIYENHIAIDLSFRPECLLPSDTTYVSGSVESNTYAFFPLRLVQFIR